MSTQQLALPSEIVINILSRVTNVRDISATLLVCSQWMSCTLAPETWTNRFQKYSTTLAPSHPQEDFLQAELYIQTHSEHEALLWCVEQNYWEYLSDQLERARIDQQRSGGLVCAAVDGECWNLLDKFLHFGLPIHFAASSDVTLKNTTYWQTMLNGSNEWLVFMRNPSALHIAVYRENHALVAWLLEHCPHDTLWKFVSKSCKRLTLLDPHDPNEDFTNVSPLHLCAARGLTGMLRMLLQSL